MNMAVLYTLRPAMADQSGPSHRPPRPPLRRYQAVLHAAVAPGSSPAVDELERAITAAAAVALAPGADLSVEVELLTARAGPAVFVDIALTTTAEPTTARAALTRACGRITADPAHYGLSSASLTTALTDREDPHP